MNDTTSTFVIPCLDCGTTVHVIEGIQQPHDCHPPATMQDAIAIAYWNGFDEGGERMITSVNGL